jgi:hypothetical protein
MKRFTLYWAFLALPIVFYFEYNVRSFLVCGIFMLIYAFLAFNLFCLTVHFILLSIKQKRIHALPLLLAYLLVGISILFRNDLLVLQESILFKTHREEFDSLVVLADNCQEYCLFIDLPKNTAQELGEDYIYVVKEDDKSTRLIAFRSKRSDLLLVYFSETYPIPVEGCLEQLDSHWYICLDIIANN